MAIETVAELSEVLDGSFDQTFKDSETIWNGRVVSIGNINNHNSDINLCGVYLGSVYGDPELASPFWGYFDSEAKKQNEFDIAVYQYHIRCNNEESKKALESAFEKMATGMVGVVIGVVWMIPGTFVGLTGGGWMVYQCGERIWKGVEDFKHAMEAAGTSLDEVRFVTWYDDYKRNTDELMQNTILSPWKPLDTSSFELMDKQYERKTLDPTFNPWTYA